MKNNIDYIYEYSDLNRFHTRVQILTGKYKDIIFEYTNVVLCQWEDKNKLEFKYDIYYKPQNLIHIKLKADEDFVDHIIQLICNIVEDRRNDKFESNKLDIAASYFGVTKPNIKIDKKWYPKEKIQPEVKGLQGF
jgi:hypothetical protein